MNPKGSVPSLSSAFRPVAFRCNQLPVTLYMRKVVKVGGIVACFGANKDTMPFVDVQKKKSGGCLQLCLVG